MVEAPAMTPTTIPVLVSASGAVLIISHDGSVVINLTPLLSPEQRRAIQRLAAREYGEPEPDERAA
jgi:hypothetical protein